MAALAHHRAGPYQRHDGQAPRSRHAGAAQEAGRARIRPYGFMDPYDAVVLVMWARLGRMPPTRGRVEGPDGLLPLFVGPRGKPWTTADTRSSLDFFVAPHCAEHEKSDISQNSLLLYSKNRSIFSPTNAPGRAACRARGGFYRHLFGSFTRVRNRLRRTQARGPFDSARTDRREVLSGPRVTSTSRSLA